MLIFNNKQLKIINYAALVNEIFYFRNYSFTVAMYYGKNIIQLNDVLYTLLLLTVINSI